MKKFLKILILFLVSIGIWKFVYAVNYPEPIGYVNDFANVLNSDTKSFLETKLTDFKKQTSNEIAVVTINNLEDLPIETYAVELFEKWRIGKKEKDNGVLLLIAITDRKLRIEVGYGLEGALTDSEADWIIRNKITPYFKKEDYSKGIEEGVNAIVSEVSGETVVTEEKSNKSSFWYVLVGFIFFGIVIVWLGAILSRSKNWYAGGLLGGIIGFLGGYYFYQSLWGAFGGMIVFGAIGCLFDYLVSKNYKKAEQNKEKPSWWAGGSGWHSSSSSGSSSGSSFGGFSGGSSGGGGASGGW